MKKFLIASILLLNFTTLVSSCGSSKHAAEAERKKQELKQRQDKLDQDKKRFEMQNNKELK